jgi:hypothetical protein
MANVISGRARPIRPHPGFRRGAADPPLPGPLYPRFAGPVQRGGQAPGQRVRAVAGIVVARSCGTAAQAVGIGGPVHRDAMEQADGSHRHRSLQNRYEYNILY